MKNDYLDPSTLFASYSVKDKTITIIDDRYNDKILTMNRKQALWLAETILKNFGIKLT